MGDFYIARGNLLPDLTATLRDADGVPIDLTGATVQFVMRARASTVVKVDAPAVVVSPTLGQVKYIWQDGDTDTPGAYKGRWVAEYPGDRPLSTPNDEHMDIMISGA